MDIPQDAGSLSGCFMIGTKSHVLPLFLLIEYPYPSALSGKPKFVYPKLGDTRAIISPFGPRNGDEAGPPTYGPERRFHFNGFCPEAPEYRRSRIRIHRIRLMIVDKPPASCKVASKTNLI
jgi:hypothetical protein